MSGHRSLGFYPANHFFFVSLIREPVARALSLFNHYTQPQNGLNNAAQLVNEKLLHLWRQRGLQPDDLYQSIKQSRKFKYEINNQQCRYLSSGDGVLAQVYGQYIGYSHSKSFQTARDSLLNINCLIGMQENIKPFAQKLAQILGVSDFQLDVRHTGRRGYREKLKPNRTTLALLEALNKEDSKLFRYIADREDGYYLNSI